VTSDAVRCRDRLQFARTHPLPSPSKSLLQFSKRPAHPANARIMEVPCTPEESLADHGSRPRLPSPHSTNLGRNRERALPPLISWNPSAVLQRVHITHTPNARHSHRTSSSASGCYSPLSHCHRCCAPGNVDDGLNRDEDCGRDRIALTEPISFLHAPEAASFLGCLASQDRLAIRPSPPTPHLTPNRLLGPLGSLPFPTTTSPPLGTGFHHRLWSPQSCACQPQHSRGVELSCTYSA
jgi:hypothetical protein